MQEERRRPGLNRFYDIVIAGDWDLAGVTPALWAAAMMAARQPARRPGDP
jgi:hypothetical protein